MANTKDILIVATVPFDWTSKLTDREAKIWCAWTVGPHGLDVSHIGAKGFQNEHGGFTTMYQITVQGVEAVKTPALVAMVESLRRQDHAEILAASYVDLDDGGVEYDIPTPDEQVESEQRAKEYVDRLFSENRPCTRSFGNGVSETIFVPKGDPCPEGYTEG